MGSAAVDGGGGVPYIVVVMPKAATVLLCLLAAASAEAAERVVFSDGRVLEVQHWQASGEQAILEIAGGGEITIPLSRVASVERVAEAPAAESIDQAPEGEVDQAWRALAGEFADAIAAAAGRYGLDPALLTAVAKVESDFDPYAVSDKRACGLLQLLPETGERFGVGDLFDAEQNLEGGARYLRWLLDRFDGRTDLALAAYNAGEQAVERHGGIPPYPETRAYVSRVLRQSR